MENNELQDITLKVKVDTYKALTNYIHNELKITKEDIEKMINDATIRIINQKVEDPDFLYNYVQRTVNDHIRTLTNMKTWDIKSDVNRAIEKCVGELIMNTVREQLKGVNITTTEN